MAKSRVKGILVEIGGDTSALEKALSKVNGNISSLSKELKDVNSLLKLDPKNTELVSQKQENLTKNISETSKKLKSLEDVQDQVYQKWQNYIKLQPKINEVTTSIENTKKELEKLKEEQKKAQEQFDKGEITEEQYNQICQKVKECKNNLSELKEEQKELNKTTVPTESYQAYQREIIETKNKLNSLKAEASNWTKAGKSIEEFGNKVTNISNKIDNLGNTLTTRLTLPIVGVATAMVSASKEFETAFTGVEKTVDGTAEQMEELRQGIKNMSKEIPSTTTEISAVAEAAGQLGIKTEDILSFTRVMIDLGNSTNLSAEEAASSLAKFANVTKMSAKDYDKLGSTIVALGNNFATTEADIVAMATYLASTGELAGLSQSQILSLATAMSSVGIEAEAGGSAMSKLLKRIQVAVETGSEDLKDFAKVAGMSTKEFKKAFEEDAVKGLSAFISGLNDTKRNGKSAIAILESMDIKEVRLSNTILSLANASEVMNNAVELGSKAWEENTALTNEANKRYQTLDSRLQTTKNKIVDMATNMGNKLTPKVNKLLDGVDGLIDKFDNLSDEEIENIISIGKFVMAVGPAIKIVGTLGKGIGTVSKGFGTFSQAIAVAKNNTTSTSESVNKLVGVINFFKSPVGLATTSITLLTVSLVAIEKQIAKNVEKAKEMKQGIEEQIQARQKLRKEQEQHVLSNIAEIDNTQSLYDELKKITDENGKIKEGYEKRANFIATELSKNLGIEIEINNNVIKSYQDIQKEIDKTIAKKRAEAYMQVQEENYRTALQERASAYEKLTDIQDKYNDAIKRLKEAQDEINKSGGNKILEAEKLRAAQAEVKNLSSAMTEQKELIKGYTDDVKLYETNAELMAQNTTDSYNKIIENSASKMAEQKVNLQGTLNEQILSIQDSINKQKELMGIALSNQDETNTKAYESQIKANEQQLTELGMQLAKMTSKIEDLTPEQVEAWQNLANTDRTVFNNCLQYVNPDVQEELKKVVGTVSGSDIPDYFGTLGVTSASGFNTNINSIDLSTNDLLINTAKHINENKSVQSALENTGTEGKSKFEENINKEKASGATDDYMKGANEGIENKKKSFWDLLFGIGKKGNQSMRDGLGDGSPSVLAKKALIDYFLGADIGIEKQGSKTLDKISDYASMMNEEFSKNMNFPQIHDFGKLQGKLSNKIIDSTKTVYTTPNLTIYTQEFDARKIADEVNKVFGSQY